MQLTFNLCYTLGMFQQLCVLVSFDEGTETFWICMHLIATINLSLNVTSDYKEPIRVIWTTYYGEICYNSVWFRVYVVVVS